MNLAQDIKELLQAKGYYTLANDIDFGKKIAEIVVKSLEDDKIVKAAAIGRCRDRVAYAIQVPIRWTTVDQVSELAIDAYIEGITMSQLEGIK